VTKYVFSIWIQMAYSNPRDQMDLPKIPQMERPALGLIHDT
jgi:hypothetical protein